MSNNRKKGSVNMKVRRAAMNVIMVCLAIIVVLSGYKVFTIIKEYRANQAKYDNIANTAAPGGFTGDIDFEALRAINPDIVGWLYYENSPVNYPIVKGEDNDKYLHTVFDGSWGDCGTLFVDCVTDSPFKQFNTIVYGHHMRDGSMFNCLKRLKDPDYCKEHPQFELVTPEGKYHLIIWAFVNPPSDSDIYTTNIYDEEAQASYLEYSKGLADYITSIDVAPGDRLVMLSTCAYEYNEARYIAICKMVPWE